MHFQCPRPKLTQLQARFAASAGASLFLLVIYLFLSSPRLAYALEIPEPDSGSSTRGNDHNWFRLDDGEETVFGQRLSDDAARDILLSGEEESPTATSDAVAAEGDGTEPRKRQASSTASALPGNNTPIQSTIKAGQTLQFVFPSKDVFGPHGPPGAGLPGQFDQFQDAGGDDIDFFANELLSDNVGASGEQVNRKKRQDKQPVTVFISINTCTQPNWTSTGHPDQLPPQLTLYFSETSTNVGPSGSAQFNYSLDEGFAAGIVNATGDVHIAVTASEAPSGFTGDWSFQLAASIDDYFHDSIGGPSPLYLVDTDSNSALMVTDNVTQAQPTDPVYSEWMNLKPVPFILFAQSFDKLTNIIGMRSSFCALQTAAQITANPKDAGNPMATVQMEMITRGLGTKPKQQFLLKSLAQTSSYQVFLAMSGNSTASGAGVIGGGGRVWSATNLTTKTEQNCALLFNLPFCDTVAYAVPSNPYTYNTTSALASFYDDYAASLYTNFSLSLQLIPCNATSTSRYSLSHDCDDCAAAYKAWLCAVTIPRCMDYSTPLRYLQPRNVAQKFFTNQSVLPDAQLYASYNPMEGAPGGSGADQLVLADTVAANQSRVARIDSMVQPGPYKELLPCEDLCFDLVRMCPAALGFTCPAEGRGLDAGYGKRNDAPGVSCSFAGAVYQLGAAGRIGVERWVVGIVAVVVGLVLAW
ncbi:hypothetical protein K461DRAFT_319362 [Myriangium duriaei CBS 260.36]|uniref:FZ domain-containing protein n=1 Tax=Myriangium duriaei CBS 260.36 TaxID=1168546 RepID=A0A9P4MJ45_9PEZI|nr:hypothetical protein K461DRAFT_319362 [Myriangium duriaei CBS 260.36]